MMYGLYISCDRRWDTMYDEFISLFVHSPSVNCDRCVFYIMLILLSALPSCEVSCVLSMRAFSTADIY